MAGDFTPDDGEEDVDLPRISTGSDGLDDILGGGFDAGRLYLYEGRPAAGKTTIALQFPLEGVRRGERVLYVTLSETTRELRLIAKRPRVRQRDPRGPGNACLKRRPNRHALDA